MSLTCELSGESLNTGEGDVVVTPSGHLCLKRLLLAKLAENGGMDPFHEDRPLTEDQLVAVNIKSKIVPPRPQAASLPSLLTSLQQEYDALVLELFDTRKALEETRQELSQALYQNDAAVRVVARLAMERDAARQELQTWKAEGGPVGGTAGVEPASKKRKLEETTADLPLTNDLPEEDLQRMISTWETLHKGRKAAQKEAAVAAPSKDDLAQYKVVDTKSWHKTSCKGITAMAKSGDILLTAGKDKQIIAYDCARKQVVHTLHTSKAVKCVDLNDDYISSGQSNGEVRVYSAADGSDIGHFQADSTAVIDVRIHPDGEHMLAASGSGRVTICRLGREGVSPIGVFESEDEVKYTCGCLHPDGLIYIAGSKSGEVLVWDIKSKSLASTLKEESGQDGVVQLSFSNNGYHIAAAYESGMVRVWDLRKQKCVATLNEEGDDKLKAVEGVAFDDSGKYLAYGGPGGARVTTVKEWTTTAALEAKVASGLVWGDSWIATRNGKKREIGFYGVAQD